MSTLFYWSCAFIASRPHPLCLLYSIGPVPSLHHVHTLYVYVILLVLCLHCITSTPSVSTLFYWSCAFIASRPHPLCLRYSIGPVPSVCHVHTLRVHFILLALCLQCVTSTPSMSTLFYWPCAFTVSRPHPLCLRYSIGPVPSLHHVHTLCVYVILLALCLQCVTSTPSVSTLFYWPCAFSHCVTSTPSVSTLFYWLPSVCHVHTLYVCFPRSPQGFPLQAFLPVTFTTTFVVTVHWQLSFSDT